MCCKQLGIFFMMSNNKKFEDRKVKELVHAKEDGGGIGWGDHFLSYKFIERTIER